MAVNSVLNKMYPDFQEIITKCNNDVSITYEQWSRIKYIEKILNKTLIKFEQLHDYYEEAQTTRILLADCQKVHDKYTRQY